VSYFDYKLKRSYISTCDVKQYGIYNARNAVVIVCATLRNRSLVILFHIIIIQERMIVRPVLI
jgi:hypothetical protein